MDHHHKPPREFNFLSSGDFLTENNSKEMDLFSASANKIIQDPHPHNPTIHYVHDNGASTLPHTYHHDPPYLNLISTIKSELGRVHEENRRLRSMLDHITKSYSQLQAQLFYAVHQQKFQEVEAKGKLSGKQLMMDPQASANLEMNDNDAWVCDDKTDGDEELSSNNADVMSKQHEHHLSRVLGKRACPDAHHRKDGNLEHSSQRVGSSSKLLEEQVGHQVTLRKPKVSVRARSETPMISDGCQWRKYGQKMAKGNPSPRGYYRCSMAVGCPVRKQVQRCASDKAVVITTYEGNHNHPLPPAASAMANTTSAAAAMLVAGSSSSSTTTGTGYHIHNHQFSTNALSYAATLSPSAPFPTITLDLTQLLGHPLCLPHYTLQSMLTSAISSIFGAAATHDTNIIAPHTHATLASLSAD